MYLRSYESSSRRSVVHRLRMPLMSCRHIYPTCIERPTPYTLEARALLKSEGSTNASKESKTIVQNKLKVSRFFASETGDDSYSYSFFFNVSSVFLSCHFLLNVLNQIVSSGFSYGIKVNFMQHYPRYK